ncbi:MAG TPA: hypothetical protein DCG32_06200 [Sphaerochaeta sp.]|jgi:hypothetical protein|nr:hypothetical protein [Sphaerochaeta sp.]
MKRVLLVVLTISLLLDNLFAFAGFDDIFEPEATEEETKALKLSVSGSLGATVGGYFDGQIFSDQLLSLHLVADSPTFTSDAALSFDAQAGKLDADTISVTSFFDWGFIKAGLLKEEWGSGDGLHVVDVLNAFDYSRGLSDDIFSMKRASFMVTSTIYKDQSSLQLYLKPTFKAGLASMDKTGQDRWSLFPAAFSNADIREPKTDSLEYVEFGARGRTSIGGADVGLLYYKGHMAQMGYGNFVYDSSFSYIEKADIIYTPYQLIGTEATYVLGRFTLMAELAYLLSKDTKGTDSSLYNSKWVYLGGIGYLASTSGLYLSLIYNGHYTEQYDLVKSNVGNPLVGFDVDHGQAFDNKAYGNTLTFAMERPLFRERVHVRLGTTYQIETEGFALLSSIRWQVSDDLKLECKAVAYGSLGSKASLFRTWDDNDYLTIGITHNF